MQVLETRSISLLNSEINFIVTRGICYLAIVPPTAGRYSNGVTESHIPQNDDTFRQEGNEVCKATY